VADRTGRLAPLGPGSRVLVRVDGDGTLGATASCGAAYHRHPGRLRRKDVVLGAHGR